MVQSAELEELGFDRGAIERLVVEERLVRVHRGVYRDGAAPASVELACRTSLAAVGPRSALAVESSAHRQDLLRFPPERPQVVVPMRRRIRDRSGFDVHRFPDLIEADVAVVDGLRCTRPARTVLDLAAAARSDADRRAVSRALRQAVNADRAVLTRLHRELVPEARFAGSRLERQLRRRLGLDFSPALGA